MRLLHSFVFLLLTTICVVAWAGTVNVNKASSQVLADQLDGVGQVKADAIVAYRKAHGPFKSVDDLDKVTGIGAKTIEDNRANMEVGEPAK